ncbi:hypothetical protein WMC73_22805 [Citrobacter braakii]|uniref:hypothetical protein n=1 Tax=Citrobacter braakii TaxID=57706 RepID=UPI00374F6ADB
MNDIKILSRADCLKYSSRSLGLSDMQKLDNALIAQALRRTVFIEAPCSIRTVCSLVMNSLSPLSDEPENLKTLIYDIIDDLVNMGDLLEMRDEIAGETNLVLRPAPPAFVLRIDGTFIIVGVAGDDVTPPQVNDFNLVYYSSGLRTLTPSNTQSCRQTLIDLGLIELPMITWLRAPVSITADKLVKSWISRLPNDINPEKIENFEIIDISKATSYYKGRWQPLNEQHAGVYIARRPQRYGERLWCVAEIRDGLVQRFVDIHSEDARFRDCDEAWRLLAAMDALSDSPQQVRVVYEKEMTVMSFTSPLPSWAIRRLSLVGKRLQPHRALMEFTLPLQNSEEELRWLEETLWLTRY